MEVDRSGERLLVADENLILARGERNPLPHDLRLFAKSDHTGIVGHLIVGCLCIHAMGGIADKRDLRECQRVKDWLQGAAHFAVEIEPAGAGEGALQTGCRFLKPGGAKAPDTCTKGRFPAGARSGGEWFEGRCGEGEMAAPRLTPAAGGFGHAKIGKGDRVVVMGRVVAPPPGQQPLGIVIAPD